MGDAADDAIMWSENEGAFIDDEEIDDVEDDTSYGFFQKLVDKVELRPPSQASVDLIAKLFDVPPEYVGDARPAPTSTLASFDRPNITVSTSEYVPRGTGYLFAVDPANPDITVMASKPAPKGKAGLDWDRLRAQYPTYVAWVAKHTNVPQKIGNPKEKYTVDMSGIAKMRTDLEDMLAKFTSMVAIVERFGGEPDEGSVIKFEHDFDEPGRTGETVYTYVAVRKFGKWYVTGRPFAGRAVKWAELLEFIGEGRAWICREFEEVPVPGAVVDGSADKAAAVASLLANSDGGDTAEVAAEVVALLESK